MKVICPSSLSRFLNEEMLDRVERELAKPKPVLPPSALDKLESLFGGKPHAELYVKNDTYRVFMLYSNVILTLKGLPNVEDEVIIAMLAVHPKFQKQRFFGKVLRETFDACDRLGISIEARPQLSIVNEYGLANWYNKQAYSNAKHGFFDTVNDEEAQERWRDYLIARYGFEPVIQYGFISGRNVGSYVTPILRRKPQ